MAKAIASYLSTGMTTNPSIAMMELVCPVKSLSSLRAAIDNGADCVQIDASPDNTHSHFQLGNQDFARGLAYARFKACKVVLSLDIKPTQGGWVHHRSLLDQALAEGIDTILLSDPGLMLYATAQDPAVRLHYAIDEASMNAEAILWLRRQFGISRIIMPRVVSIAHIAKLRRETSMEIQVFGFGQSCSVVSAQGQDMSDPISAADADSFGALHRTQPDAAGLCASIEQAANDRAFAHRGYASAGTLQLLPLLRNVGIHALRVDAAHRSPAQLGQVIRVWREAIDVCAEDAEHYTVKPSWLAQLDRAARNLRIG
jgi:collagenase-like PrtC family protease